MKGDSSPPLSFMMVFFSPLPRSLCLGLSLICHLFLEFQLALVAKNSLCLFVLGWKLQPCLSYLDPTTVILVTVICNWDYYNTLCRGLICRHYKEDNHSCRMPFWFLMDDISHREHTGPAFWHLHWLLIHFQVQLNQVLESDRKPWLFWRLLSFRIEDLGSGTGPSWVTLGKPFLSLPYFPYLGIMMSFQLKLENYTMVRTYKVIIRFDTGKQTLSLSADLMKFSAFPHNPYFSHIPVD